MNLVFLVNMLYHGVFRDTFDGMLTVHDFVEPFLYLNGVGLLFHLFLEYRVETERVFLPC